MELLLHHCELLLDTVPQMGAKEENSRQSREIRLNPEIDGRLLEANF